MPPSPTATVTYRKKDGTLTISADHKYLFFTPAAPPAASPAVTIPVADITNLQQTPEKSAKVALKVLVKNDDYTFYFTSKDAARKEQETVTDTLRNQIAANKASSAAQFIPPTPEARQQQDAGDTGQSAAMAIAKAVSSKTADDEWYDDNKLIHDIQLQRSLLDANKSLAARFNQALKERPESVSVSQFTSQFWSARLHLLRAHAIEKTQQHGQYNVLPEIRFTRIAGEKEGDPDIKQLNITKEQINLLFKQYPVVKEAYNENVPPLDSKQFWTRFFSSRLLKKLKGEKITSHDPPDSVLDKYVDRREGAAGPAGISHIPHFMDLEGNEQNHSQRKGNRPDQDMRPSSYDKVPILRVLNNLSEKMLAQVAPEDGEAHQPVGMDEETFEQLRLRDLAMDDGDYRVRLNVREQARLGGSGAEEDLSAEAKMYARLDSVKVLDGLRMDLDPSHLGGDGKANLKLDQAIGYHSDDDSDSEEEDDETSQPNGHHTTKKRPQIGSHPALKAATTSILTSIHHRRLAASSDPTALLGLSQTTFDQLTITHNTTTEFLHYFWSLFLSGDATRTSELAQLVATLDRCLDRFEAVAVAAEEERGKKVEGLKRQVAEYERRTGKRRRLDLEGVGGGQEVVERMVKPTVEALRLAGRAYKKALEEQMGEVGAVAAVG